MLTKQRKMNGEVVQNVFKLLSVALISLCLTIGCATSNVTNRQQLVSGQLPRPSNIWVYDFAATPADVPADSSLAGQYSTPPTPQTAEQTATGRKLGAEIAAQLVEEIEGMGLPAEKATIRTKPRINDIVIRGYFLSVDEGSTGKRVTIGFGSGTSELKTAVEGFQMTKRGMRKLGSGTVDTGGSKGPGMAAPAAIAIASGNPLGLIVCGGMKLYGEKSGSSKIEGRVNQTVKEITDQLRTRFQQAGWIQ
jgi:hypothetical protein